MSVLFNLSAPQNHSDIFNMIQKPGTPASEKIATVFQQLTLSPAVSSNQSLGELFDVIGIHPNDLKAQNVINSLLPLITEDKVNIFSCDESHAEIPGMLFLASKEATTDIAIFKVGRKRAAMETLMRRLAHLLSLSDQIIPSVFCAIQYPPFTYPSSSNSTEENFIEPIIEPLWNGNEKQLVLLDHELMDAAITVIGVIQPFLKLNKSLETTPFELVKTTILALAGGIRDIKKEGLGVTSEDHLVLFDTEDAMPYRNFPKSWKGIDVLNTASVSDCSFLDGHPQAEESISKNQAEELATLVKGWNIPEIIIHLQSQQIRFADSVAERSVRGEKGLDEENHPYEIEKETPPHVINGIQGVNIFTHPGILIDSQLMACHIRLLTLRSFIEEGTPFNALDLVLAVDPHSAIIINRIKETEAARIKTSSPQTNQNARFHNLAGTGSYPPSKLGIPIGEDENFEEIAKRPPSRGNSVRSMSSELGITPPPSPIKNETPRGTDARLFVTIPIE